ncbi:MAG: hypothetical protein HY318_14960, partial [Armatimonadetes bacterium]|nr:hypothetical protein [Armatimonadota bacterium]
MMTDTTAKPYPLALEFWTFRGEAAYSGRLDHRQLLQIRHPWVESAEGGFGEWSARVTLPAEFEEREKVYLSFYTSDDYSGERLDQPGWIGAQAFSGHRFKQLLINGEVVWEEDVAEQELLPSSLGGYGGYTSDDPSPSYSEAYRVVDITSYARAEMQITVRVFDRVASSVQLAGDQFYRFSWGTADPQQARNWFQTEAFFGDLVVSTLPDAHRQEPRKIEPCSSSSTSIAPEADDLLLELRSPGDLPTQGYPVRGGVPIPHGLVRPATTFALVDPTGESVPVAITETSHWSDGSVRWVLCEFVAKRGGTWRLQPGERAASPLDPVTVLSEEGSVSLDNGAVATTIGKAEGEGLFEELAHNCAQRVGPGRLSIKLNRVGWLEAFKGLRREVVVEKSNPVCAVVRASGDLLSDAGTRFGPWTARIEVWSRLPYVFIDWGIINESDQSMAMLLDWSVRLSVPDSLGALLDFGNFQPVPLEEHKKDLWYRASPAPMHVDNERALPLNENTFYTCRQEGPDQARVYSVHFWVGVAEKAPGYVCMKRDGRSLVAAMRWFAEEFPKGIQVVPGELRLATLPESEGSLAWLHDAPFVRLGRGEGKRQRFALWLSEGDVASEEVERFAACLHDPPRLYDRAWFLKSHALETAPPEQSDDMQRWEAAIGPVFSASGLDVPRLGHREHWDTVWMNNYRSRAHA